jgi:hypothetical protein
LIRDVTGTQVFQKKDRLRQGVHEGSDARNNHPVQDAVARSEAVTAREVAAEGGEIGEAGKLFAGHDSELPAGLGNQEMFSVAFEKFDAEVGFEFADLAGELALPDRIGPGGFGDASGFSHGHEGAEAVEGESTHLKKVRSNHDYKVMDPVFFYNA